MNIKGFRRMLLGEKMQDSILQERHRSSELYVQPPKEQ